MKVYLKDGETVEDLMVGGVRIIQNKNLYRFSSDAVLLSKFAEYKGGAVADFCSGSGIVGLHFYALNPTVERIDCYEIQNSLSEMAERSVLLNDLSDKVNCYEMPIQEIPVEKNGAYSLILCNPPYKKVKSGELNEKDCISVCRHEITVTLEEIISVAAKKLAFRGRLCLCQRPDRLVDALCLMRKYGLEPSRLKIVSDSLFLVEGIKGGRSQLKIIP